MGYDTGIILHVADVDFKPTKDQLEKVLHSLRTYEIIDLDYPDDTNRDTTLKYLQKTGLDRDLKLLHRPIQYKAKCHDGNCEDTWTISTTVGEISWGLEFDEKNKKYPYDTDWIVETECPTCGAPFIIGCRSLGDRELVSLAEIKAADEAHSRLLKALESQSLSAEVAEAWLKIEELDWNVGPNTLQLKLHIPNYTQDILTVDFEAERKEEWEEIRINSPLKLEILPLCREKLESCFLISKIYIDIRTEDTWEGLMSLVNFFSEKYSNLIEILKGLLDRNVKFGYYWAS